MLLSGAVLAGCQAREPTTEAQAVAKEAVVTSDAAATTKTDTVAHVGHPA